MADFVLWPKLWTTKVTCRDFCCFFHEWSTYTPLLYPPSRNKGLIRPIKGNNHCIRSRLTSYLSFFRGLRSEVVPIWSLLCAISSGFRWPSGYPSRRSERSFEFSPTRMVVKSWGFFMATKKSEVFSHMCFLEEVVYVCLCAFFGGAPFEVWSKYSPVFKEDFCSEDFWEFTIKEWSG